jgi:hypothetical protein
MDWMNNEQFSAHIAEIKARIDYLRSQLETPVVEIEPQVELQPKTEAPKEPTGAEKLKLALLKGR